MRRGGRWLVACTRGALCALAMLTAPTALWAQSTAPSVPLERRVSMQFRDISLREALDRVMAVAQVRISYSAELLPLDRSVRGTFDSVTVGALLVALLKDVAVVPVVSGRDQVVLAPVRDERAMRATPPPRTAGTAELDRVVVTGSVAGAAQRPLTIALSVIDGRDVGHAEVHDISSALSVAVPGLWAWEQSPASLIARYGSIRGASSFGANYPKIYVDGLATANPLLVTQFDPESVQRIEVIRGPQGAALYGADAISGVVNIVTRHEGVDAGAPRVRMRSSAGYASSDYSSSAVFAQDHRLTFGIGSSLRTAQFGLGLGSLGAFYTGAASHSVQASAGGRLIGARTVVTGTARLVSGSVGTTVNPLLVNSTVATAAHAGGAAARRDDAQSLQAYTVGATVKYAASDRWTHTLVAGVDGYVLSNVANDFTPFPSSTDSALRAARGAADRTTLRVSSVARLGRVERLALSLTFAAEHSALRQEAPVIQLGRAGMHQAAVVGLARAVGPMGSTAATQVDWVTDAGFTTQADVAWRDRWFLSAGLRLERNSGYVIAARSNLLPMIGGAWVREFGDVTLKLRTAFGHGIRAPRNAVRETMFGMMNAKAVVRSLAPEEQSGVEGGIDLLLGHVATLQVTRFGQLASGLIQQVIIPDSTSATANQPPSQLSLQYQNVGSIGNHGWELQATVRQGRLAGAVSLATVDSRVRSLAAGYTGDLRPGDRVLGVPGRTAGASATWSGVRWKAVVGVSRAFDWIEYDRLSLAAAYVGFDRATVPLYGADLRGYWRTYAGRTRLRGSVSRAFGRGASLVLTGENLLNFQRGEPDNVTIVPGRTITTGARLSFY
ncbi:MAG: hypothetical protein C0497_14415 [Gemmatimonas sp.]|nr:hypothetical protein [Gemmatimonas sp.]